MRRLRTWCSGRGARSEGRAARAAGAACAGVARRSAAAVPVRGRGVGGRRYPDDLDAVTTSGPHPGGYVLGHGESHQSCPGLVALVVSGLAVALGVRAVPCARVGLVGVVGLELV